jgi:hypothetical protein
MDHRELLKKYIAYIGMVEGTDFLMRTEPYAEFEVKTSVVEPIFIKSEDWAELVKLSDETM